MKIVTGVLGILIGLALIVGGYSSYKVMLTLGACLMFAGVLVLIMAIMMIMKMKCHTKTPPQ